MPAWVDHQRLLDDGPWTGDDPMVGERSPTEAADLAARLRNVVLAGVPVVLTTNPPLGRALVRAGRTAEARRLRDGSPGFTRPDARVDELGRTFLTPEKLALAMGRRVAGLRVVDACAGCGGNAIGFARAGCTVTAIERDRARLELARHNARVYGVEDRVTFVHGDALAILPSSTGDLLFLDPPWGDDGQVPLLGALVAAGDTFARIEAKVPPAYAGFPDAPRQAWWGHAPGDRQRVKLVLLTLREPLTPVTP